MCNSTPMTSEKANISKLTDTQNANIKQMFKSQITNRLRHDISQITSFKLNFMDQWHRPNLIQTQNPYPHDVLCGRGGGINSHPGNKTFRQWVRIEKERYNLAINKAEKNRISRKIIDQVRNLSPPGRFLMKDSSKPNLWVEIDDMKAMAKTSQALREGAPSIRAVHQQLHPESDNPRKKRKRRNSADVQRETKRKVEATTYFSPSANIETHLPNEVSELNATTPSLQVSESPMPHLSLTQSSNHVELNKTCANNKSDEIPTSIEVPHTILSQKPESATFSHEPAKAFPDVQSQISSLAVTSEKLQYLSNNPRETAPVPISELNRSHSLATSEIISSNDDEEFHDPFADDNPMDISVRVNLPSDKLIHKSKDANKQSNIAPKSQNDDKRYVNNSSFQVYLNLYYITHR